MENSTQNLLTNAAFMNAASSSFEAFLRKGTSRSTDKLKPLHGAIANDIASRLGDNYGVFAQGYAEDREEHICGRYIDKKVDITISRSQRPVAGIAVKFVMQNYSQNSNNYFENMLGETANIRSARCPYFQVFVILDRLPYFDRDKKIAKWECFTEHNMAKYVVLSKDNPDLFYHTPNKTLMYVVHLPEPENEIHTQEEYLEYYRNHDHKLRPSNNKYDAMQDAVILNDYEKFIDKVYHTIKAL